MDHLLPVGLGLLALVLAGAGVCLRLARRRPRSPEGDDFEEFLENLRRRKRSKP